MSTKEIMERERWATEEAFVRGNIDALDEVFAPDGLFHRPPLPDIKKRDEWKQFAVENLGCLTDVRWDWDEVIIEGDKAVQRYTIRGKHTGSSPMFPVPPTGKEVAMEGCTIYHLKNGKVVAFYSYDDFLGLLQQLGMAPSM